MGGATNTTTRRVLHKNPKEVPTDDVSGNDSTCLPNTLDSGMFQVDCSCFNKGDKQYFKQVPKGIQLSGGIKLDKIPEDAQWRPCREPLETGGNLPNGDFVPLKEQYSCQIDDWKYMRDETNNIWKDTGKLEKDQPYTQIIFQSVSGGSNNGAHKLIKDVTESDQRKYEQI